MNLRRHVLHDDDAGAAVPAGRCGTSSASARGPPVEAAIATHDRARPGSATERRPDGAAARRAGQHRQAMNVGGASRAERTEQPIREPAGGRRRVRSSSLATRSTAPSSSARIAAAVPGPAYELTTTIGRGDSDMM